jgi:hypothetical protein
MQAFPAVPRARDAPSELFAGGHLWLREHVDGLPVRFQLQDSGVVRFGDRERVFRSEAVPLPYRHVVSHVRERLDRGALRAAVDDVESVTFFGTATVHRAVDYDWERTPSFLGIDVHSDDRLLPPDAVESIYDRLGLTSAPAVAKEVRAVDFDPERDAFPASAFYDGTAAGVVVANKTGLRAVVPNPAVAGVDAAGDESADASAAELAARYATDDRLDRIAQRLDDAGRPVTFEAVFDRLLEALARERYRALFAGRSSPDVDAVRATLSERTSRFLAGRG